MHRTHASAEMSACIQACLDCYRHCQHTALTHCLEMGGEHVEPDHFRLMMDCAEICDTSADFLLRGSERHPETCRICGDICKRCAEECMRLAGNDDAMLRCADFCVACAESCTAMAGAAVSS